MWYILPSLWNLTVPATHYNVPEKLKTGFLVEFRFNTMSCMKNGFFCSWAMDLLQHVMVMQGFLDHMKKLKDKKTEASRKNTKLWQNFRENAL